MSLVGLLLMLGCALSSRLHSHGMAASLSSALGLVRGAESQQASRRLLRQTPNYQLFAQTLLAGKKQLLGSNYSQSVADRIATWKAGSDPCADKWWAVGCSPAAGNTNGTTLVKLLLSCSVTDCDDSAKFEVAGGLPSAWSSLGTLPGYQLTSIDFSYGSTPLSFIKGATLPPQFSTLSDLSLISLYYNNMSGTLPPQYSTLSKLSRLSITGVPITGSLPAQYSALTSLARLTIFSTNMSGRIPSAYSALSQLSSIALSYNRLTGQVPASFSALESLVYLESHHNNLSGTLPPEWGHMRSATKGILRTLQLNDNAIGGSLPESFSLLSSLNYLFLSGNQLMGSLPACYSAMSSLGRLEVARNRLAGTLPTQYNNITTLYMVDVTSNHLSGTFPKEWFFWPKLKDRGAAVWILASNNSLTGSLPGGTAASWPTTFNTSELSWLALADNRLTGTIPEMWSRLSGLGQVQLGNNPFTPGPVPLSWVLLNGDLYSIDLRNTSRTGTLPPQYSQLKHLQNLILSGNKLQGSLPPQYSYVTNLGGIALHQNQLTGSLPAAWSSLKFLNVLDLSNNDFKGTIPSGWGRISELMFFSLAGNKQLCGALPTPLNASVPWPLVLDTKSYQDVVKTPLDTTGLAKTFSGAANIVDRLQINGTTVGCSCGTLPSSCKAVHGQL